MRIKEDPNIELTILHRGATSEVKTLVVYLGKWLTLQKHQFRSRNWFIVVASGITENDVSKQNVKLSESLDQKMGTMHRVTFMLCKFLIPIKLHLILR